MGIISQIQRILGAGSEHRFIHPDLGELIHDGTAWRTAAGAEFFVSIYGTRPGPDERLVTLATSVWNSLGEFEKSARGFVEARAPKFVSSLGRLGGADFLFPDKDWLRQERALVPGLTTNDPVFSLTFELHGDRNVLDVTFAFERPVHVDYH
jgi:hypothetical protein